MRVVMLIIALIVQLNSDEPQWMKDPSMGGKYVGAIGCAQDINNSTQQEKMAILRAKGSISQGTQTHQQHSA